MAKYNPCPVPGCPRNISITSKVGVCSHHDDTFQAITYYLQMAQAQAKVAQSKGLRSGERVTAQGLILPGG